MIIRLLSGISFSIMMLIGVLLLIVGFVFSISIILSWLGIPLILLGALLIGLSRRKR